MIVLASSISPPVIICRARSTGNADDFNHFIIVQDVAPSPSARLRDRATSFLHRIPGLQRTRRASPACRRRRPSSSSNSRAAPASRLFIIIQRARRQFEQILPGRMPVLPDQRNRAVVERRQNDRASGVMDHFANVSCRRLHGQYRLVTSKMRPAKTFFESMNSGAWILDRSCLL